MKYSRTVCINILSLVITLLKNNFCADKINSKVYLNKNMVITVNNDRRRIAGIHKDTHLNTIDKVDLKTSMLNIKFRNLCMVLTY